MFRWRAESGYLGRYLGSGIFNTLVGFAVIFAVMGLGFSPFTANIAGYATGFALGFFLSKKIVFRSQGRLVNESIRYLIAFLIAFILNFAVLHIALNKFALPAAWAQLAGAVTYTAAMYMLTRYYTFSPGMATKKPSD